MRTLTKNEVEQVAGGLIGGMSLPVVGGLPLVGGLLSADSGRANQETGSANQSSGGPIHGVLGIVTGLI